MRKKINWDSHADFYNKMAMMELSYTIPQLKCLDMQKTDTVLDIGCGPGRISILSAKQAKQVTSLDSAPHMLAYVQENAKRMGVSNINTVLMDWSDVTPGKDVEKHDIVIASRTGAMRDVDKLSSLANKYAAIFIWANAPSIPELTNKLFIGVEKNENMFAGPPRSREHGYNIFFNNVYNLGYDPNIKIFTDGFVKTFKDYDEVLSFFWNLKPDLQDGKQGILRENLSPYLTEGPDGITFRMETRSCVIWWKPEKGEVIANPSMTMGGEGNRYTEEHQKFYGEKPEKSQS